MSICADRSISWTYADDISNQSSNDVNSNGTTEDNVRRLADESLQADDSVSDAGLNVSDDRSDRINCAVGGSDVV